MWEIRPSKSVEIIAEIGCNHKGSMDLAKAHIDVAAGCGAATVKFQCYKTKNLVNAGDIEDFCRQSELNFSQFQELQKHCKDRRVDFLLSCFCTESLDMADALGCDRIKVPSGQTHNRRYLEHLGKLKKKVLLSTGMCTIQDVRNAVEWLTSAGTPPNQITLMQCTTAYPAPIRSVHLAALWQFKNIFPELGGLGFSDHTLGYAASIFAAAMGAGVIERHFILPEAGATPDAPASLLPYELRTLVNLIRDGLAAIGSPYKDIQECEQAMKHRIDYGDTEWRP